MANGFKTGGREKGTPNKLTLDLRKRINDFLNENWESIQKDFEAIEPKERLLFYEKLLSFGLPKLQSTHLTSDFERLSDEELDYIINNLKNSIDE